MTKRQRTIEGKLMDTADMKNRQELTKDDKAKYLRWLVVGKKKKKSDW
jgi:hypothetical protein